MMTKAMIRDRAMRMGIATGDMPEVDLIWAVQEMEGNQPCFGHGASCPSLQCRWRSRCMALEEYSRQRKWSFLSTWKSQ